jgi:formyl-CoA transferase
MYVEVTDERRGSWFNVGMPIKLSASPAVITRAPYLGEHIDDVLLNVLGYGDAKVAALKAAGAFSASIAPTVGIK